MFVEVTIAAPINSSLVGQFTIDLLNASVVVVNFKVGDQLSNTRIATGGTVTISKLVLGQEGVGSFTAQFNDGALTADFDLPFCTTACGNNQD